MTAYEFILSEIDRTTKSPTEENADETLVALPNPYTTPCAEGMFQETYYWDTYFTHKCLLLTDREEQALNNLKNFAFLIEKYGKIPNGNRLHYLGRSQPPFFGLMLSDFLEKFPEKLPLQTAYEWLEKEYAFWMQNRLAPNGLNKYGCDLTDAECLGNTGCYNEIHTERYEERTGIHLANTVENGANVIAECESGWDFSPRFHSQCTRYNPVDLNALLYADETLLSAWANRLGNVKQSETYAEKAERRRAEMSVLMKKDGVYYDYNFISGKRSDVVSCAAFYPYFVGADKNGKTFDETLALLERTHGVVACLCENGNYQWAQPNGWAPLHYVAAKAADALGKKQAAKRIVDKYLGATNAIFERTGRLWEKYNAETGALDVQSEYGTPEMLGWSAGVYVAFERYRQSGYKTLF